MGKNKNKKIIASLAAREAAKKHVAQQKYIENEKREINSINKMYGRDGAYMETDLDKIDAFVTKNDNASYTVETKDIVMDDTIEHCTPLEPDIPLLFVINNSRIEISNKEDVKRLFGIIKKISSSKEAENMNRAQRNFYAFRKIFEAGIEALSK